VIAIVDLGKMKDISQVAINFLRDQRSWIFLPTEVEFLHSADGRNFKKIKTWKAPKPFNTDKVVMESVTAASNINVRYIKVVAKKMGALPTWHLGHPHDGRAWIFVDEIVIK
tara:strand:+ start:36 stop:371 length:336 start_codon:yes stop_codon:yes gene_type:complete